MRSVIVTDPELTRKYGKLGWKLISDPGSKEEFLSVRHRVGKKEYLVHRKYITNLYEK